MSTNHNGNITAVSIGRQIHMLNSEQCEEFTDPVTAPSTLTAPVALDSSSKYLLVGATMAQVYQYDGISEKPQYALYFEVGEPSDGWVLQRGIFSSSMHNSCDDTLTLAWTRSDGLQVKVSRHNLTTTTQIWQWFSPINPAGGDVAITDLAQHGKYVAMTTSSSSDSIIPSLALFSPSGLQQEQFSRPDGTRYEGVDMYQYNATTMFVAAYGMNAQNGTTARLYHVY